MAAALAEATWVRDLGHGNVADIVHDFVDIWTQIQEANINLSSGAHHTICWKFKSSGDYSAWSAYRLQFQGVPR